MILRVPFHVIAVLCLLLVIVCIVGWVRSFDYTYRFSKVFQNGSVAIGLAEGSMYITDIDFGIGQETTGWQFHSRDGVYNPFENTYFSNLAKEEFSWAGFRYRVMPPGDPAGQQWLQVKHIYMYRMPIWSLIVVLSLPLFVWFLWFRRHRRIQTRIKSGLCIACGYDLRESTGKSCPECGGQRVQSA